MLTTFFGSTMPPGEPVPKPLRNCVSRDSEENDSGFKVRFLSSPYLSYSIVVPRYPATAAAGAAAAQI